MTLADQVTEIEQRIERTGIGLRDALSVIDATFDEQMSRLDHSSPYEAFSGLNALIDRTVHGARIERFAPRAGLRRFHTFEIHTEEGEVLGYLNMLHLQRPIPCYYLVYVEVMPSFRGLGFGTRIMNAYMRFLSDEKAVGLLDNIIPSGEPAFEMYTRLGWKALADYMEGDLSAGGPAHQLGTYMIFVPDSVGERRVKEHLTDILLKLSRKRPVIDMHDNDDMVGRTIEEFRSVYRSLARLFRDELASAGSPPLLMRFMFTRLTTKLIGFRRRIATLIGYTGGESLQQITFPDEVLGLPIQPYSLWDLDREDAGTWGDHELLRSLPRELKEDPTAFIEALPWYDRPYLRNWIKRSGGHLPSSLTIGDLLDCDFDPTKLKEFHHGGADYIFERISFLSLSSFIKKRNFLMKVEKFVSGTLFQKARAKVNPILLIIRDRGNTYILRRKLAGIHSQEALDQLRTVPYLRDLNQAVGLDRSVRSTIKEVEDALRKGLPAGFRHEINEITYFVPWHIEENLPAVSVDIAGISLGTIWIS